MKRVSYKTYQKTIKRFRAAFAVALLIFSAQMFFPQYTFAQVDSISTPSPMDFPLKGKSFPAKDSVVTAASAYFDPSTISLTQVQKAHRTVWSRYMTITAYSSTKDQTDDTPYLAARGHVVHWGMVAANDLPIGTKVRIPDLFGDQVFTVLDRMNRRYTGTWRVDVWMPTRPEAKTFGKRYTEVEIVTEVEPEITETL